MSAMYACTRCKSERWVAFDRKDTPIMALGWTFTEGWAYCRRCSERFRKRKRGRR